MVKSLGEIFDLVSRIKYGEINLNWRLKHHNTEMCGITLRLQQHIPAALSQMLCDYHLQWDNLPFLFIHIYIAELLVFHLSIKDYHIPVFPLRVFLTYAYNYINNKSIKQWLGSWVGGVW